MTPDEIVAELADALSRLSQYNANNYFPDTNPFGLGGKAGTDVNWRRVMVDMSAAAAGAGRLAALARSDSSTAADDRAAVAGDAVAVHDDRVAADADARATAADRAAVHTDRLAADADALATATDRAAVHDDRVAADADALATATDRAAVHDDRVAADADALATATDRAAVHTDRLAADAAAASAATARDQAIAARPPTWCGTATGTATAIVLTPSSPIAALVPGLTIIFMTGSAAAGAITVVASGLPPVPLLTATGSAIAPGAWAAGELVAATYDGTAFRRSGGGSAVAASTTQAGITRLATSTETGTGTATDIAVTPAGLASCLSGVGGLVSGVTAQLTAPFTLTAAHKNKLVRLSGNFTVSVTATATLGVGFCCILSNEGSQNVTIDPNGSELVNGYDTIVIPGKGVSLLICDGVGYSAIQLGGLSAQLMWDSAYNANNIGVIQDNGRAVNASADGCKILGLLPLSAWKDVFRIYIDLCPYRLYIGLATHASYPALVASGYGVGGAAGSFGVEVVTGYTFREGSTSASGLYYTTGDYMEIAVDNAAGKAWINKNGVWQASGDPVAGTNPFYTFTPGTLFYPGVTSSGGGKVSFQTAAALSGYTVLQ